jgi:hypothetical protein
MSDSGEMSYIILPAAKTYGADGTSLEKVEPDVKVKGLWPSVPISPLPALGVWEKEDEAIKAALAWLRKN